MSGPPPPPCASHNVKPLDFTCKSSKIEGKFVCRMQLMEAMHSLLVLSCVSTARLRFSYFDSYTDSYEMNKSSTGTNSDAKVLMEIPPYRYQYQCQIGYSSHRIGIGIGIGVCSVETVLHIIIEPNFIGIGVGIGVGQWKHTITTKFTVYFC